MGGGHTALGVTGVRCIESRHSIYKRWVEGTGLGVKRVRGVEIQAQPLEAVVEGRQGKGWRAGGVMRTGLHTLPHLSLSPISPPSLFLFMGESRLSRRQDMSWTASTKGDSPRLTLSHINHPHLYCPQETDAAFGRT